MTGLSAAIALACGLLLSSSAAEPARVIPVPRNPTRIHGADGFLDSRLASRVRHRMENAAVYPPRDTYQGARSSALVNVQEVRDLVIALETTGESQDLANELRKAEQQLPLIEDDDSRLLAYRFYRAAAMAAGAHRLAAPHEPGQDFVPTAESVGDYFWFCAAALVSVDPDLGQPRDEHTTANLEKWLSRLHRKEVDLLPVDIRFEALSGDIESEYELLLNGIPITLAGRNMVEVPPCRQDLSFVRKDSGYGPAMRLPLDGLYGKRWAAYWGPSIMVTDLAVLLRSSTSRRIDFSEPSSAYILRNIQAYHRQHPTQQVCFAMRRPVLGVNVWCFDEDSDELVSVSPGAW